MQTRLVCRGLYQEKQYSCRAATISALELFGNDSMMHIFCVLHDFHMYAWLVSFVDHVCMYMHITHSQNYQIRLLYTCINFGTLVKHIMIQKYQYTHIYINAKLDQKVSISLWLICSQE